MKSGTKLRVILTVIATPFLVVGYLNIEKLAEKKGWDGILSGWVDKMPDTLSGFIVSPFMAMLSAFIVGIVVGLWVDTFLRASNKKKTDIQILGAQAIKMSQLIDKRIGSWNTSTSQDLYAEEISASILLLRKIKNHGIKIPKFDPKDQVEELKKISTYFKYMSPHMLDGDKSSTKKFSKLIVKD